MVDIRQYCDNCPQKDPCSLEQKRVSISLDYYETRDGRKIYFEEARDKESYNDSSTSDYPSGEQMSLYDFLND